MALDNDDEEHRGTSASATSDRRGTSASATGNHRGTSASATSNHRGTSTSATSEHGGGLAAGMVAGMLVSGFEALLASHLASVADGGASGRDGPSGHTGASGRDGSSGNAGASSRGRSSWAGIDAPASWRELPAIEAEFRTFGRSSYGDAAPPDWPVPILSELLPHHGAIGDYLEHLPPGEQLAQVLAAIDLEQVDTFSLVEVVAAFKRLEAWAAAKAARAAAALAERDELNPTWPGTVPGRTRGECVAGQELAMRLRVSRLSAIRLAACGRAFGGMFEPTGRALEEGLIDFPRAQAIVTTLLDLPAEVAMAAQAEVLRKAPGRTLRQVHHDLAKAVIAVDPDSADARHRAARKKRCVHRPRPLPDGMASVTAVLTAGDAVALDTTLEAAARAAKNSGDRRTLDQLRADSLALMAHTALELGHIGPITGVPCPCGCRSRHDATAGLERGGDAKSPELGDADAQAPSSDGETQHPERAGDQTQHPGRGGEETQHPERAGDQTQQPQRGSGPDCPEPVSTPAPSRNGAAPPHPEVVSASELVIPDATAATDSVAPDGMPPPGTLGPPPPEMTEAPPPETTGAPPPDRAGAPSRGTTRTPPPDRTGTPASSKETSPPHTADEGPSPADEGEPLEPGDASPPVPTSGFDTGPPHPGHRLTGCRLPRVRLGTLGGGRADVRVTVPLNVLLTDPDRAELTALERDPEPVAELERYGPIPHEVARALAAGGVWRRLVTDPLTQQVLNVGRTRYQPTAAITDHVRERDRTCVRPGCSAPATTCDLDHEQEWQHGGETSAENIGPLCTADHPIKSLGAFTVAHGSDRTYAWTTPTGHGYLRRPDGTVVTLPRRTAEGLRAAAQAATRSGRHLSPDAVDAVLAKVAAGTDVGGSWALRPGAEPSSWPGLEDGPSWSGDDGPPF